MRDPQAERRLVADWIASMKGARTGEEYAADVRAVTGWSVDRSRLSRYANGSIHIGRDVIAHMSRYAEATGHAPLDLSDRPAPPDLPTALLALAQELAALREERQSLAGRVADLEAQLSELVAAGPSARGTAARATHGAPAQ